MRIFPDLDDDLLLRLFHKGAAAGWTSRDLDLSLPLQLSPRQGLALARLLTPVYLGEQTAMAGASAVLPQLMAAGETPAQLYLATFIMDEARHFEALTRVYHALGQAPMRLREMPDMLRYHHRLRQGDRVDWVWGILISDLYAKLFYRAFVATQPGALFGRVSARILEDESRHQAFAVHYLRRNVPRLDPARHRALLEMRDDLLHLIEGGLERLRADCDALGFDGDAMQLRLLTELEHFGRRIGLPDRRPPGGPPDDGTPAAEPPGHDPRDPQTRGAPQPAPGRGEPDGTPRRVSSFSIPECFGCLLVALCRRSRLPGPAGLPGLSGA